MGTKILVPKSFTAIYETQNVFLVTGLQLGRG